MASRAPSLTLPLCAFSGFAPDTQAHLEALFEAPLVAEGETFRGLLLKTRNVANSTAPHEVQILLNSDAGKLRAVRPFSAPSSIRNAIAAAGFLLANDKGSESLTASMSLNSGSARHPHFAVTDLGCISWRPGMASCYRDKAGQYQIKLESGEGFLAYVATSHPRSAHEKIGDRNRLLPLAEDLYAADIKALPASRQTGTYRKVHFVSSTQIRSPYMAGRL